MSITFRILGLDIAAIQSGAAVVEVRAEGPGLIEFEVLEERHLKTVRIAASQPPSWGSMLDVSAILVDLVRKYGVTRVGYEGYAKGGFGGGKKKKDGSSGKSANTTAYEQAELTGHIKTRLWDLEDLIFLQIPPTTLNSFYGLQKGDKKATQKMLKERLGWESRQRYWKEREDCSDAVAHAMAAGYVFAVLMGWDPDGKLPASIERLIFGDQKKSGGIVGLLHRPHLYIPRDACVTSEDDHDRARED